ncbi:hypothetical protein [Streptomyces sp. NPDC127197]|uniref:hypothetical protein n=1 Tax=Streptomyces sp. NPDC127197 TaxID=3345388 RepID=UPI003624EBF7
MVHDHRRLAVDERDKLNGPAAEAKRIYTVGVPGNDGLYDVTGQTGFLNLGSRKKTLGRHDRPTAQHSSAPTYHTVIRAATGVSPVAARVCRADNAPSIRGSGGSTVLIGLIEPFVGLGRPGVLGVAIRRLPSRGLPRFAARHPTTTRPPIRKCEQVAA